MTLPREWIVAKNEPKQVMVIHDGIVLIFTEDERERVEQLFETLINQTVQELANARSGGES